MEELIAFFAWNLEAHEPPALSRNDRLQAFSAMDNGINLHMSLPELCLLFLLGQIHPAKSANPGVPHDADCLGLSFPRAR